MLIIGDFILAIKDKSARLLTSKQIQDSIKKTLNGEFFDVKFVKSKLFKQEIHSIADKHHMIPKPDIVYGLCDICQPRFFEPIPRKWNFVNRQSGKAFSLTWSQFSDRKPHYGIIFCMKAFLHFKVLCISESTNPVSWNKWPIFGLF